MEPIEITTKQKKKLLEMCKALFPEDNLDFGHGFMEDYIQIVIGDNEFSEEWIHWFEFCLTHLINKINYPPNAVNNGEIIVGSKVLLSGNPVDYLYREFQKLKKRKKKE